ncbi:uroporphyrinogen-III synthase [Hydrogenothermus marinus]|uniref:Uroporphyrinogen-III synthase n=1 Tax=Hydrogenothermus marinus TaxID=133270 RepID=A0A3M0BRU9_9AQUI|nr:uroporphyrinogen-III synthase [Hydrogenothermus marinus]RMA97225.1 uroporphyrinogen-III synthase [Hydrogenothermus marinus]
MKTLLITREDKLNKSIENLAKSKYVNLIYFPLIKTIPLDFDYINLPTIDGIIFSSKKAVDYFLKKQDLPKDILILAVGNKTGEYLKNLGFNNIIIPEKNSAEGIKEIIEKKFKDKKFIHITTKKGRPINLPNIKRVFVYDTKLNIPENKYEIYNLLKSGNIDYILFSSPSTFLSFKNLFKDFKDLLKNTKIISIGNTTKKEIEKEGLKVDIIPTKPSFEEIIKLL